MATRRIAVWSIGALITGGAAAAVLTSIALRSDPPQVSHMAVTLTPDLPLSPSPVALSPDGRTLAMTAGNQLVLRSFDGTELRSLPGTEGATHPFFSPDGTWVAFFAGREIRRIRVDGTNPLTISTITRPAGGSHAVWGPDDTVFFGAGNGLGLFRVPASGGTLTPVAEPRRERGEIGFVSPQVLPGGRSILFTVSRAQGGTSAILSLDSGEWQAIPETAGGSARYVSSGHLVYQNGETAFAVRFDSERGLTIGKAVPVIGDVSPGAGFTISPNGTLAYIPATVGGVRTGVIVLADRGGSASRVSGGEPLQMIVTGTGALRFAPDNKRFVASLDRQPRLTGSDLWVYDTARGTRSRLTTEGLANTNPVWSRDGTELVFNSAREPAGLFRQPVDQGGLAQLLVRRGEGPQQALEWTSDGRTLIYQEVNPRTGYDVWTLSADGKSTPLLVGPAQDLSPRLSPDGRWLVYQSDRSGRMEVYVTSFPALRGTQVVSPDGGTSPRWAGAREIVYRRGRQVLVVPVAGGDTLALGRPTVLFEADDVEAHWDVSADGTRFLMFQHARDSNADPGQVNVVLNFDEELKRLVPTN
jgi:serine/threonine-protein kinase